MSDDILGVADKLWRGELTTEQISIMGHFGGLVEVTDDVAFLPTFANVSAVSTSDGLLLVDTGSPFVATLIHEELRRWTDKRLHTAVYSHGHIDHVFGVPVWEAEAATNGWDPPRVIAHRHLPRRFDRYKMTAGYNAIINRRQFGVDDLEWPTRYRYPDETFVDDHHVEIGGLGIELRHEKGETDDHTITWIPSKRVLCCGDLFIWASPNAGNPQKVQRYPGEWAQALRRMVELEPEYLLPGHGFPVVGADRVTQALTDTAEYLESIVDQTVALLNAGARLDEAVHSVRPPAALAERPYLQPVYDEPEFIVHNVWRLYGGWWDGNPATLKPAPESMLAAELAELAGGAGSLADRALVLLAMALGAEERQASDLALRLAGHLAEMAWLASPDDQGIQAIRHRVFSTRAEAATSTMAKGIFRWAARESGSPSA